MDWLKWKFREFKKWFTYFIMYRGFWKKLWNSESDKSYWEILHDNEDKTVTLHYISEEDYCDKDVKIKMKYEQFEDLIKFIIRIR
ncbi:MAG: hypothetical protein ACOCV1_07245 [Bacillota bacterium]